MHESSHGQNEHESPVAEEASENVEVLWSNHAAVDEVEELQEHKGLEDDSVVAFLSKASCV